MQDLFERLKVVGIDEQQLVLVELNFHRAVGVERGHAGAAVVQQERLVVVERALEDHRVHVLAIEIGVGARFGVVARFHDHVDDVARADRAGP